MDGVVLFVPLALSDQPGVAYPLAAMSWEVGLSPQTLFLFLFFIKLIFMFRVTQNYLEMVLYPLTLNLIFIILLSELRRQLSSLLSLVAWPTQQ